MTRPTIREPSTRSRRDRGQAALLLVLAVAALTVASIVAAASLGSRAVERAEAQTAADAVALAGLTRGRAAAAAIADRHGVEIEQWRRDGAELTVVVRRGAQTATAAATDAPGP